MTNPIIETDLAEILKEIRLDQKQLLNEVTELKVGQARIEGKIEALDTKVEQLDKRVSNQEFASRGILNRIQNDQPGVFKSTARSVVSSFAQVVSKK